MFSTLLSLEVSASASRLRPLSRRPTWHTPMCPILSTLATDVAARPTYTTVLSILTVFSAFAFFSLACVFATLFSTFSGETVSSA